MSTEEAPMPTPRFQDQDAMEVAIYAWLGVQRMTEPMRRHPANLHKLVMALAWKVNEMGQCLLAIEKDLGIHDEHNDPA